MSPIIKLYFLRTHLMGEAVEKIKSIAISSDNYETAWTTITDYYENKRRMVSTHVADVFSAKPMKAESSSELKRLVGEIINPLEY